MEMLVAVGLGVGLASVAGVRAFLPLALAALFTIFGLFEFPAQVFGVDGWIYFENPNLRQMPIQSRPPRLAGARRPATGEPATGEKRIERSRRLRREGSG